MQSRESRAETPGEPLDASWIITGDSISRHDTIFFPPHRAAIGAPRCVTLSSSLQPNGETLRARLCLGHLHLDVEMETAAMTSVSILAIDFSHILVE